MSANNNNNNTKMKGLLKGLRYISQIFDNEKEPEMKIGLPTDVKHVAHIGWDGPSVNSAPSWMNEFKSPSGGGFSSAPLADNGREVVEEDPVKWVSQDGMNRKGSRGQSSSSGDTAEVSKSSRRSSSTNGESSMKERTTTDRGRQPRKTSKDISDSANKPRKPKDSSAGNGIPKKSGRKKKLKDKLDYDDIGGGSSRRNKSIELDTVSESESRFSNASGFEDN